MKTYRLVLEYVAVKTVVRFETVVRAIDHVQHIEVLVANAPGVNANFSNPMPQKNSPRNSPTS